MKEQEVKSASNEKESVIPSEYTVQKEKIRSMINSIYDIQKMRIQCGNRLVASFMQLDSKSKERINKQKSIESTGSDNSDEEKVENKEVDKAIKNIMSEYNRITDMIAVHFKDRATNTNIQKAIESEKTDKPLQFIGSVYDYKMADTYQSLISIEQKATAALSDEIKKHPMWDNFFAGVRGCGPMMAAVCIAYFDVYKARHPSSFWKYAGLDVVVLEDGKTEGRSKKHTEMRTYMDKDNNIKEKNSLTYNPVLKSKLVGVLGPSFIKSAKLKDGQLVGYGKTYYDYKHRLENRVGNEEYTPLRIHRMAVRYAVKQFVRDLWIAWRTYEGLDIGEPFYEVQYLGHKPHGYMGV